MKQALMNPVKGLKDQAGLEALAANTAHASTTTTLSCMAGTAEVKLKEVI